MNIIGVPQGLPSQFESVFASLHNENVRLREQNNALRRQLFGSKSERYEVPAPILPQGSIFNEAEQTVQEATSESPSDSQAKSSSEKNVDIHAHTRKVGGKKPLPADLPREIMVHDLPEKEKVCPNDGTRLVPAGKEIIEKLEYEPAKLKVIEHHKLKYACPCCEQHVARALAPAAPLPGIMAEPGLLAATIVQKFLFALPLYRQELIYRQLGIELPRITLARWVIGLGEFVRPIVTRIHEYLVSLDGIHCDESTIQVLKGTKKAPTATTYMWVAASPEWAQPAIYFEYHNTRAQSAANSILKGFKGYLQVDGYGGYNAVCAGTDVIRVACWAHVRRKFDEAKEAGAKNGVSLAAEILGLIQKLFLLEREWRDLEAEARLLERKVHAPPILEQIKKSLDENRWKVPPKSKLGSALNYLADEWDGLVRFLDCGRIALSNNRIENFIRPFAIGRRNWLFADTLAGAEASASLYSLVVSARANGLNVQDYLQDMFSRMPSILRENPDADLNEFLPWVWKPQT